ncbi:C45 family autoproteolytic acyltransferase/hydolase [Solirubrobacter soli]|uniref:C45 family autoproteolytic acyltransferase/hydolase n=1 Tax=Solirubrobacter soli TaxID=363832 RepID=UPI00041823A8|nr:C45 family peptidase [Solirubrobacter soli]
MDAALTFTAVEDEFAARWARLWPALHDWYLRDGDAARPSYLEARHALRAHMPELAGFWETWSAGMGDLEARALSLYDPPPLLAGCSQAVVGGELIRNYDYDPARIEGTIARTTITRPVLGMSDCVWGLLDGINDAGLAVALAFGGRNAHGRGFGITIVVRYLLETCDTVEQAVATLARLPIHAPYNLTLADRAHAATVFVGPDRPARAVQPPIATNHQEHVDWPEHAAQTHSVERRDALLADPDFLAAPLYATNFARGFGTLYTAVYRPAASTVTYRWPGVSWDHALHAFTPGALTVRLSEGADRHVGARPR